MYWISNYVVKVMILLDNISVSVSNFSFNGGEYFDRKKVNITKNVSDISLNLPKSIIQISFNHSQLGSSNCISWFLRLTKNVSDISFNLPKSIIQIYFNHKQLGSSNYISWFLRLSFSQVQIEFSSKFFFRQRFYQSLGIIKRITRDKDDGKSQNLGDLI